MYTHYITWKRDQTYKLQQDKSKLITISRICKNQSLKCIACKHVTGGLNVSKVINESYAA